MNRMQGPYTSIVEQANQIGLKLLGRRVTVEAVENKKRVLVRDQEHPNIGILVPVERVENAIRTVGHWIALPKK